MDLGRHFTHGWGPMPILCKIYYSKNKSESGKGDSICKKFPQHKKCVHYYFIFITERHPQLQRISGIASTAEII
jgi:hypothetical protein